MNLDASILDKLREHLKTASLQIQAVGDSSINSTFQITASDQAIFCKVNSATKFPHLFRSESAGLKLLAKQAILKTPKIIDLLETNCHQVLLLEWIQSGTPTLAFWKTFGEHLAHLHKVTQTHFGLHTDNYMGVVPQVNTLTSNWPIFFIQQRLQPLVQQCHDQDLLSAKQVALFENLYQRISLLFEQEPPALLHGDLWSGNFMCTIDQQPILIDPAVYFGHRSMDLGMTTLFGGFSPVFYEAYNYHYPLPSNYKEQWTVCNLYPLLIHLILFGKSYLPSIEQTLNDFQ